MVNQINFQWRVTKYNPDFRDENGYYTLREEWTCPSEIGKTINGNVFTLDEYLQVEEAYINSVIKFIEESSIDSLRILQFKCHISEEGKISPLYEKEFEKLILKKDSIVNKKEIRLICKMVLRNFLWCELYSKDNFFVHFGWDYYMYIGSNVNCLSTIKFATNNGLFVEQFTSPHAFSEEETTRQIQWNEIGDESKLIVGEEELKNIPLNEYQRIFNLSAEHPVIGSFDIKKEQLEFFQTFLKHKLNFDKYEYMFWGGC
ncbi:hypothetical protein CSE16_06825 [Solibacillus sp. R5-41]|uniref:DUF7683 domain-containing protein n=1 Tax=Solibacillus sp. R5-41 TaxID=2048654 RepID=UPI000C12760C|nr:hypothetical protein [Solibacillus sp. R5-41]ATP39790.1 hypothetical protein CSE16_06825 [Solibacillus sp. R5-41]